MQISEFAEAAGVSVRTLRYYDEIGLLKPAQVDRQSGYRLYDEAALERLHDIRFYQSVGIPLGEIPALLSAKPAERQRALAARREVLIRQRNRLDSMIRLLSPVSRELAAFVRQALAAAEMTGIRQCVLLPGERWPDELCPPNALRWEGALETLPVGMRQGGMAPSGRSLFLWRGDASGEEAERLLKSLSGFAGEGSSLLILGTGPMSEPLLMRALAKHGFLLYDMLPEQAALVVFKRQV